MKHLKVFVLLCGLILCGTGSAHAVRGQLGDPVDGDQHKHNFSVNANADGPRALNNGTSDSTQICIFCHTPHAAAADSTLWNRPDPIGPNGDGTFPLYGNTNASLELLNTGTTQDLAQYGPSYGVYPNGASRLCLSCHDGVTAIGGVLNTGDSPVPADGITMAAGEGTMEDFYGAGDPAIIDLAVSHPISFIYNAAVATAIESIKSPLGIYNYPPTNAGRTPLDGQSRMQCTTCHDPHTDTILEKGGGYDLPMWRYTGGVDRNADFDGVCDNCHAGFDDTVYGNLPHDPAF